jgi:pimeloyl-ACP methyl ester carboxylesterase
VERDGLWYNPFVFHMTLDRKKLYYELHGRACAERWLVFLNGLAQSTAAWALMLPFFKPAFRIVLLDFIFQGRSDKDGEARDFDRHAADVAGLLYSLGVKKVSLIGISYGSLVAQHFALNYPESLERLILLSTFANKTAYYEAIEHSWLSALEAGGSSLLFDVMLPLALGDNYFKRPPISLDVLRKANAEMNSDSSAIDKLMAALRLRGDYRGELRRVKTPTLVIHGEHDLLFPLSMGREAAEAIPGSRFEVIPGAGHTLNLEAVPETAALIARFMA